MYQVKNGVLKSLSSALQNSGYATVDYLHEQPLLFII